MAGKGEQTRTAVLAAAIARFGREGYRATSVADVARDAGVGPTVPYAYFPNKEALFFAACDEDAAGLVAKAMAIVHEELEVEELRFGLILTLVDALPDHPLAGRLLGGLEPGVTDRVLQLPALEELRKGVAERLRTGQLEGHVRADIDPVAVGQGMVAIVLSLLMSVVQLGIDVAAPYAVDVAAVMAAALEPPTA
jgi:AcrR family transcriptional regulator